MKKLILLLLLFPCLVQGQKQPLQGRFYPIKQDIGFENELFAFEGKSFHLTVRHCQGKNIGQGKYQLEGDTLVLIFADYPTEKEYTLISSKKTTADSATIRFTIKSQDDNSPLPGANVVVKDVVYSKVRGTITDQNGEASLKIGRNETNKIIHADFIGFVPVEIPLDLSLGDDQQYNIWFGSIHYYQKGEVLKYRIKKLSNSRFEILFPNNYKIRFAKVSPKKYQKLKK